MNSSLESLGITVLQRGWLSSNCTVICNDSSGWLVDSGYATHARQTVELVRHALGHRKLSGLINTHLHSDHCGGNALLQQEFGALDTWIPPGLADAVRHWDPVALTYEPTGQQCQPFAYSHVLQPGIRMALGQLTWEVHAAPGHDPHAILLFEPQHGVLISGDALWENGFGVVFPELEGQEAFGDVDATLKVIEQLDPAVVIPGHGSPFTDLEPALIRARKRLHQFRDAPHQHAEYAAKVLLKFHLLEKQRMLVCELADWYEATPYFQLVGAHQPAVDLSLPVLIDKLIRSGAARLEGDYIFDA